MTRSPWVRLALGLLALTVLALGALRSARVWAERQFERELGSLKPAAYTRPAVKTDDNAARYFLAAVGKLRVEEEEAKLLAVWALHPEDPADGRLAALVAKNEAALRLAKQGAGLFASFYGLDYGSGFHAALPDLPQLVTLGRLLVLEARLARERGETGRMVSALSALASLSASLESEPGITVFHAGVSLERLQLSELALALEDPRLPTTKLSQLREGFSPVALEEVFRRVVGLEEASLRQEVPEKTGLATFGAADFWRFASAQKARKLAALGARPCALWAAATRWEELSNHESRLLLVLAQAQGVRASRLLLQAATLCLRHHAEHNSLPGSLGFFPEALQKNPFTGQPLAYDAAAGSLAVPDGLSLWSTLHLPAPLPPFTVRLPVGAEKHARRSRE
ncbi:MAG: hypothetical protein ACK42L_00410 [Thermoanaerobaculum sp.]